MAIVIRSLHPVFAAEIRGVDISRPLGADTLDVVRNAIDEYGVIVFRNQKLNDETQIAFAEQFGPPERYQLAKLDKLKMRLQRPEMVNISNLDSETGAVESKKARHRLLHLVTRLWHIDSIYRPRVAALSMLYAHRVPPEGGETEFADGRAAYDALSDKMKAFIEPLIAQHNFFHPHQVLGTTAFSEEELKNTPPVHHPVARAHTRTGRKTIYLSVNTCAIQGMQIEDGRLLINDLREFATQRHFVYRHEWRVGDLVIWDNGSVMHRGLPYDETFVRELRRVSTMDVEPSPSDRTNAVEPELLTTAAR